MNVESRFTLALIGLLAIAFLSGCQPSAAPLTSDAQAPAPIQVRVAKPFRGEITRNVTLPASVHPYQEATLYAKVAGYLKTIAVDKGDAVKAGAVLAEIEVPELLAELARYKADVDIAEIDFRRIADAQKRAPDLVVLQNVDAARAKLEVAKANIQRAESLLNFAKIVAPFSGVITWRWVDPGAFIPAATSGSTPQNAAVVKLMDFTKVRVQVGVPEPETPLIKTGLPVKVTLTQLPDRVFEGTVTRHTHTLDPASRTMMIEIDLPNANADLRPGMFASAEIGVERKSNVLLAPAGTVSREKSGSFVYKVVDGVAKKSPVKTGFSNSASVEILEGLQADDTIIVLGKQPITDGRPVQAVEAE